MTESTESSTKLIDDQPAAERPQVGNSGIKFIKEGAPTPTGADIRQAALAGAEAKVALPIPPVTVPAVAAVLAKAEAVQEQAAAAPPREPTKFAAPFPFFILRKRMESPKPGAPAREVKKPETFKAVNLAELVQLSAQVEAGVIETPPGLSIEFQLFLELARRLGMVTA